MILQPINDLAALCARKGITQAILCPGSRCAPITLAFVRQPGINTRTISDERSAAFIALGIAQQTRQPVVLVCTSGTAAYNFAPAVAEAFYQNIPLLVLTADRPPEWIDQQDGQAIRQQNLYGAHVKKSWQFPVDLANEASAWHANRIGNEAVNLAAAFPPGPVHLNIPLREPFYPTADEDFSFSEKVRVIRQPEPRVSLDAEVVKELKELLAQHPKVMVVAGLAQPSEELGRYIFEVQETAPFVFLPDLTSNLSHLPGAVTQPDFILTRLSEEEKNSHRPGLLITFGGPVLSKNLKNYLRQFPPALHWHLQPAGESPDTFQCLTHVMPVSPAYFFGTIWKEISAENNQSADFARQWQQKEQSARKQVRAYLEAAEFGEFAAADQIMRCLPEKSVLQLGNSMPVRYGAIAGVPQEAGIEVYANRGTSGIDGSLSTAVGFALSTEKIVTVLLGDLSFFYDRNALWHNYLPQNLRIIVLNNHGGGIFDIIDGPANQPEAAEYFITEQRLTAEHAAEEAGLRYFCATDRASLRSGLQQLYAEPGAGLLEVQTDQQLNTRIFKQYQQYHEPTPVDPS